MNWYKKAFNNPNLITVYRGTGAMGIKDMRPSPEGVYGPGIYFYDNLQSAKAYAEPNGGIIEAQVDINDPSIRTETKDVKLVGSDIVLRKEKVIVVPDKSKVKVVRVIPTSETI